MRNVMLIGLAAAGIGLTTPANAAQYVFGVPTAGQVTSGVITTSDRTFVSNGFNAQTITGITGTFNGSSITSLIAGLFGSNNIYYTSGPSFVDGSGLGFGTAAGNSVNLFYQSSASSYRINTLNPFGSTFVSASSSQVAAAAVPEPATWAMMLVGFAGIGLAARRRSRRTVQFA